jgi:hypothetical protein
MSQVLPKTRQFHQKIVEETLLKLKGMVEDKSDIRLRKKLNHIKLER